MRNISFRTQSFCLKVCERLLTSVTTGKELSNSFSTDLLEKRPATNFGAQILRGNFARHKGSIGAVKRSVSTFRQNDIGSINVKAGPTRSLSSLWSTSREPFWTLFIVFDLHTMDFMTSRTAFFMPNVLFRPVWSEEFKPLLIMFGETCSLCMFSASWTKSG